MIQETFLGRNFCVHTFSGDQVSFRVVWKKNSYNVTFPLKEKALKLKEHIQTLTGTVDTEHSI